MSPDPPTSHSSALPRPGGPPSIPGYGIEKELGRGTSGVVYRARQLSVDRLVALKVMHVDRAVNARSVKRLQREARIAAHLSHPNLISAIDMGQSGGMWWFAMELVEGPSLAERLEKGGRLKETDALHIFSQLCDALQHASEKGVVHRDIKPANIILERPDHPRLADLGLARIEDDPMLTRTGATLGTPHYVSPEQARDPALADVRSDIWSLGATMYHAVCGRPPFSGSSMAEILSSVLYSPIPDPLELRPELSRGLGLVLRKCLSRDPARRYFAPAELGEDLARVAAHKPPAIRRSSLEPLDPTRGERRGLVAGALGVAILGALAVLLIWRPWSDTAPDEGNSTVSNTNQSWPAIEAFERNFDSGHMSLAAAFEELDELRERVPQAQRSKLELVADRAKQSLREELTSFWKQSHETFDLLLKERRFVEAEALLELGLAENLLSKTGFDPQLLPREIDRSSYQRRLASMLRRLQEGREDALSSLVQGVERHLRRTLLPQVNRKQESGAWFEARALLSAAQADRCVGAECDRRGLAEESISEALEPFRKELGERAQALEDAWRELDGVQLFAEVRRLAEVAAERLRTGTDGRALQEFEEQFDVLLERHQLDQELLAESPTHSSLDEFMRRRSELQDLADELAQKVGAARLATAEREALPYYQRRDYAGVTAYWQALLADPALAVVREVVDVRVEGAQELQAFLRRSVAGLEQMEGKLVSLRQGSITATGKVELRGDPLSRGFRLRETGGSPLVYLLTPNNQVEGTLLDAGAIENFATEGADLESDIGLQLQRALFRYHEGDFNGAAELLESEALQGGALIYYDLGLRVAHELGEKQGVEKMRRARAGEEVARLTGPDAEAMDPELRSFEIRRLLRDYRDVLSESAQSVLLETRRALESELPPSTLADFRRVFQPSTVSFPSFGAVSMEFEFNADEVGAWRSGDWFFNGDGWSCERTSELAKLEDQAAPTLALGDPLLTDSGSLEIEVQFFQPKDSPPELVAVSVLGFHAVFQGPVGPRSARFLCSTSSLTEAVARARGGDGESFAGFVAGKSHTIVLRLSRGSGKLAATVDGELIDSGFYAPPDALPENTHLRVRAVEPIEMRKVRVQGDRR